MSQLALPEMLPRAPSAPRTGNPALDQYFTAEWASERLIELYFPDLGRDDRVIDAGCGRGSFLKAVPAHVPAFGVEIDPLLAAEAEANSGRAVTIGDFRTIPLPCRPTAIIGNPPFSRAVIDGFIERAGAELPENGRCGFILPSSYVSFASTMQRLMDRFSIRADVLPRDLFPRVSVPISFYLFTRSHVRRHFGFVLFDEASEINGMPREMKLALYRGENRRSPWHAAVSLALQRLGGRGTLSDIYALMQGKLPRPIDTWKDTIRRTLQEGGFRNVGRGEWALNP